MTQNRSNTRLTRRAALSAVAATGIGTAAFDQAVGDEAEKKTAPLNADDIKQAEWIAGIELTEQQREQAAKTVARMQQKQKQLREHEVGYDTLPAVRFDPEMVDQDSHLRSLSRPDYLRTTTIDAPDAPSADNLSFLSIRQLGKLLRNKKVTAVQLAQHCIDRLKENDDALKCVVTLTEDLALTQAERADRELAEGKDRGPLHGIPWGAKDLIAVEGYPTTWGAPQFQQQTLPRTATVAKKLESAGAVLVAKLTLGALAMGDKWFGGMTRNPWNPEEGSSGSSAGPGSAVAAGLVPFAIGSETLGSIVSPSKRCGIAGLRPTFGRVSRKDCMSLSWTMDKMGPMARNIDDCGIVFDAIHGADPGDPTTVSRWFDWPQKPDLSMLKIGKVEGTRTSKEDEVTLQVLEELGANIVPIKLPNEISEWSVSLMLDVEAGTIFHELVAQQNDEGLNSWPGTFRTAHFVSAVDYLHAARLRVKLMESMADVFRTVDLYVGGGDLGICNLTGHPTVVFPTRMSEGDHPQPKCSTITGRLYDEATLLAIAALVEEKVNLLGNTPSFDWLQSDDKQTSE